jgi:hypothetical protein
MITAYFPSGPARGSVLAPVVHEPFKAGMLEPPSVADRERELTWAGEATPGGTVDLHFRFQGRPHFEGFHWYVDGGTLGRTGRTAVELEDAEGWTETSNTLTIPPGWRGPLRVVVVVVSAEGAASSTLVGDTTWESITLPVDP